MAFAKFRFSWTSFFCYCSCTDYISAFLLSSCSCFYFLHVLPLCWSSVVKPLLSWNSVIIVFLCIWTDHSCAWKRLSLKTCQLSGALFVFRAHSHRIPPTSLEEGDSCSHDVQVVWFPSCRLSSLSWESLTPLFNDDWKAGSNYHIPDQLLPAVNSRCKVTPLGSPSGVSKCQGDNIL